MKTKYLTHFFTKAYFIASMLLAFSSCVRNSEMQTQGADFFQGVWKEQDDTIGTSLLQNTSYHFKITCDSMYVTMDVTSEIQNTSTECYGDGHWKEYAKAVYAVREDSLIVDGIFTKPNGKQKISGCHRSGQFNPRFKIVSKSDTEVILQNKYDQKLIKLTKIQDITCSPKPRWEY